MAITPNKTTADKGCRRPYVTVDLGETAQKWLPTTDKNHHTKKQKTIQITSVNVFTYLSTLGRGKNKTKTLACGGRETERSPGDLTNNWRPVERFRQLNSKPRPTWTWNFPWTAGCIQPDAGPCGYTSSKAQEQKRNRWRGEPRGGDLQRHLASDKATDYGN